MGILFFSSLLIEQPEIQDIVGKFNNNKRKIKMKVKKSQFKKSEKRMGAKEELHTRLNQKPR